MTDKANTGLADEAFRTRSPKPETIAGEGVSDFQAVLRAMPFGQERLAAGQQFNAYESAKNDEDGDPDDWEFCLSLGPISDCVHIMRIEGEWRAKLIEAALRVAMRSRPSQANEGEIERLRAFRDRVLSAVEFVPPPDDETKDRIAADLASGLSIRTVAKKHGTTFGVVRGVRARQALSPSPDTDDRSGL